MDQHKEKPVCSFPACTFTNQSVACDGRCGRSFHAVCVGLTVEDFRVISSSPHILWVCDDCQDRFRTGSGSGKMQQEDEGEPKIPGKCSSPACFYTDKFVRCDGDCGGSFHAVCVKLPEVDLGVISSKPNLMWLCSGCGDRMRTLHEGKSLEAAEENDPNTKLQALHNHLTNILGRISGLFPVKMPHDEATFPVTSCEEVIRESSEVSTEESPQNKQVDNDQDAAKVTCDGEAPETDNPSTEKPTEKYIFAFGHSAKNVFPTGKELSLDHAGVPNSPGEKNHFAGFSVAINKKPPPVDTNNNPGFQFQSPTTAAAAKKFEFPKIESNNDSPAKHFVFLASPMKQDLPKPPEPTHFHLWLAYFEGDTTEADIDYLVRKRMKLTQLEPLNVIRLGLGRKRVSFKVDMSAHLKGLALQDDTWPQSLSYHREFVVYH